MLVFKYLLLVLILVGVCVLEALILPPPFSQIAGLCSGMIIGYFATTIKQED